MKWLALVALALLPGCALLEGEGEETLVVRNADRRPVSLVLVIDQSEGGVRVFGQEIYLDVGQVQQYALAMRPGAHVAQITTSTGTAETVPLSIPSRGDAEIEVLVRPGGAIVTVRS